MEYRHAPATDHGALDAVLVSAPGRPTLPVRLTLELFGRALSFVGPGPVTVWDPCCGAGTTLAVLGLCRASALSGLVGSDVDPSPLDLARRNLALLDPGGLDSRAAELDALAARHGKPGYATSAASARALAGSRTSGATQPVDAAWSPDTGRPPDPAEHSDPARPSDAARRFDQARPSDPDRSPDPAQPSDPARPSDPDRSPEGPPSSGGTAPVPSVAATIRYEIAVADATDPAATAPLVGRHRPQVVIADLPHGIQTNWSRSDDAASDLVTGLAAVLAPDAVIAMAGLGRKLALPPGTRALDRFRVGHRAAAIVRAGDVVRST